MKDEKINPYTFSRCIKSKKKKKSILINFLSRAVFFFDAQR